MIPRRAVIEFGVAIDLVILAIGVALLYPEKPVLVLLAFVAASALSAWKGGRGAAVAIALSALAEATLFPETFTPGHIVAFVVGASVAAAVVRLALTTSHESASFAALASDFHPAAVDGAVLMPVDDGQSDPSHVEKRLTERLDEQRRALEDAARLELERDRAELQKSLDAAAERERQAERERLATEREALEREVAAKLDAERRAIEENARQQVEADRAELQKQLDAAIAREREAEREKFQSERAELEAQIREKFELERQELEESARQRLEEQRQALQLALDNAVEHHRQIEEKLRAAEGRTKEKGERRSDFRKRFEAERAELQRQLDEALTKEREAAERAAVVQREALAELERRLEEQKQTLEDTARKRVESERAAIEREYEEKLALERAAAEKAEADRVAAQQALNAKIAEARAETDRRHQAAKKAIEQKRGGLFDTVGSWFGRKSAPSSLNLNARRSIAPAPAPRRAVGPAPTRRPVSAGEDRPRVVLYERRRGMADTVAPKLRSMGVSVQVVERVIDAADEIFRSAPHAIFIDSELPDFEKDLRSLTLQNPKVPMFVTGRSSTGFTPPSNVRFAAFVMRPYDLDEVAQIAAEAKKNPDRFLELQQMTRPSASPNAVRMPEPASKYAPIPLSPVEPNRAGASPAATKRPAVVPAAASEVTTPAPRSSGTYEVVCFNCNTTFDSMGAEWCSCLTKERTFVCTACAGCFCKAAASYKETFWMNAPPELFERKNSDGRRGSVTLHNALPQDVTRPMVLCVEDDEEIQHIVGRVCSNLGFGFVFAMNGQDGLELARRYQPDLILTDAFMPKLDGREMCRLIREEGSVPDARMVVMTGLYTDTKYRSEAVKRFHVDDYLAKPVSLSELISVLQKHLEPAAAMDDEVEDIPAEPESVAADEVTLADFLAQEEAGDAVAGIESQAAGTAKVDDQYEVCCFNCNSVFNAATAEWCSCVGRDNTLLCPHCHGCFCKAPAAYKERFWMDAPSTLFERKLLGSKRHSGGTANVPAVEMKRPLILLVEDDENVQLIVRTVVTSMGYGFIAGANGKEGLDLAREYKPDLILSDAFMPKLDGREMCRLLKQDPVTARAKAIIMTGLYTDRKYRNEALDYFRVDDYVAKPLAVDDLIKLFKKHLPQEVQPTM